MRSRISILAVTLLLTGALIVTVTAAVDSPYEVGKPWKNFCQGAVSHTFDDNMNTNPTAVEQTIFDDKKFHISLCVQSGSANWTNCKASFAKGHEISNHTVSHQSTVSDMNNCQKAIRQNVPGEKCITIAYPNCNTPGDAEVLKTHYAGRNCNGQIASSSPSNMAQIGSKMFGTCSGCPNDANGLNSFANQAVTQKGWAVYCHHGIGSQSHSWAVTNLNAMKTHINYLDQNRDKIWCETFGNVTRYIKERDAANVKEAALTETTITVQVTDNLPDSIFDYPVTIRRPLPDGWGEAAAKQDGKEIEDSIVLISSKKYIMFQAVPDGGDVVITRDPVAVLQSEATFATGSTPAILQRATLLIDSRQFKGSEPAVTLFNLSGKVLARYTLGANESRIALPMDKINRSAFIAKISGGGKTWSGRFIPQM